MPASAPTGERRRAGRDAPALLATIERQPWRALIWLIVIGTIVRLAFAATTAGNTFDLASLASVAQIISGDDPFGLYAHTSAQVGPLLVERWPYPPGYLPLVALTNGFDGPLGISFTRLVRVWPVLADAGIAALVFRALLDRGARVALIGAALVALGPSFIANSGHHGQLDSVATLPALAAVLLWMRGGASRWLTCGALIGIAAAVKTPLGLLLLALLPTAGDRREAIGTAAVAVAVPLALLAPFLVAEPRATFDVLTGYQGLPGGGGLSLLAQPELATGWLSGRPFVPSGATEALQDANGVFVIAGVIALGAVLLMRRIEPLAAAVAIVLLLWVVGVNFALGYAVWGLPFLLAAGRVRDAAVVQALLLIPIAMIYLAGRVDGWDTALVYALFVPCMLALLAYSGYLLVTVLRRPVATS